MSTPAFAEAADQTAGVTQLKSDATALISILIGIVVAVAGYALFKRLANKA